jgi:uncharacterized cupredoxin-like copper-binding protein
MNRRRSIFVSACLSLAALAVAACGGPAATPTPAATAVDVTLQEWAVLPSVATAPSGEVTFKVANTGPNDVHEFVIVKTDLSIHALPTDDRGVVDEEGGPMEVIDEVEDVAVGQNQELTVNLEPGTYALICNIYDETEGEAHYTMGMRAAFTVTQ